MSFNQTLDTIHLSKAQLIHDGIIGESIEPTDLKISMSDFLKSLQVFSKNLATIGLEIQPGENESGENEPSGGQPSKNQPSKNPMVTDCDHRQFCANNPQLIRTKNNVKYFLNFSSPFSYVDSSEKACPKCTGNVKSECSLAVEITAAVL